MRADAYPVQMLLPGHLLSEYHRWAGIVHLSEGIEQPMLEDSLTGDPLQVTLFM